MKRKPRKPVLPRAPLPRQRSQAFEVKKNKPARKAKHKRRLLDVSWEEVI